MAVRRRYAPRELNAADIAGGRTDPHYKRVLVRLLAAHALAEKLTAAGYQRALDNIADPALRPTIEKNLVEERKHARLVYRVLGELGISDEAADRMMIPVIKLPSFAAPRHFAAHTADEIDLLMGSLALDMTGLLMIGINYRDSSYAPHSRAAEIIVEEEADHEVFASELLSRTIEKYGAARIERALGEWLPRAVNFFGPPGSGFTYDCLQFGLKARDNQDLAELYLSMLQRRAEQLGINLPRLTSEYPHALA
ncbi:MAG TPA: Phenylacetic acid catabolic protein [Candidatus Binataceae bacterium]|nr:Phenylacetic acid catabolic protein [Candidatus Binataceae bacterium]